MKKILSLLVTVFACQCVLGQALQLKGLIMSSSKQPVEFANVVLRNNDSVFVTGGITDDKGRFNMNNLRRGAYKLQISCLGYETRTLELKDFTKNIDLGRIEIDTTSIALNEVVVTGANVINKVDRKVVLPSASQLKSSTNGFDLLQRLNLNRIDIDLLRNAVSGAGGGEVQLRINGVKASVEEIKSIRPEDIVRIEHYEEPGARYQNAEAVIDYIVRRRNSGGYVSADLRNSFQFPFGDNNFNAKLNHNKSEFGVFYSGSYRGIDEMYRNNSEEFHMADGRVLNRIEEGSPDWWKMNWQYMHLNYSYQEPDKWFFNATVRNQINDVPRENHTSKLYWLHRSNEAMNMIEKSSSETHIPSVDLYFQSNLKNQQFLMFNLVGTYIDTGKKRYYSEMTGNETLTELLSDIDGDKYSVIGEGIYEKGFKSGSLSAGIKHTQSYTDNTYTGSTNAESTMKQAETYLYAEFKGKVKRFNYSLGIGGTRSWMSAQGNGYQDYTLRPTISLKYNLTDKSSIKYTANLYSSSPSLSDLENVEQIVDSMQIRRGNSQLKPYMVYAHSLNYEMSKGIFNGGVYVGHRYSDKPIMESTTLENGKFVRSMENQKSWQRLNTEVSISVKPFKDLLTMKFSGGMAHFDSRGLNYHHTYTNWYYNGTLNATYKDWSLYGNIKKGRNNFYGETMSRNENFHSIGMNYRHKSLTLGMMTLNPFTKTWKGGDDNYNALAPSKERIYIGNLSRMMVFSVSYNFNFGRKFSSVEKRLNNEDKDSGVLDAGK